MFIRTTPRANQSSGVRRRRRRSVLPVITRRSHPGRTKRGPREAAATSSRDRDRARLRLVTDGVPAAASAAIAFAQQVVEGRGYAPLTHIRSARLTRESGDLGNAGWMKQHGRTGASHAGSPRVKTWSRG